MTTYFPFTPSSVVAPSFMPTLDDNLYTIQVWWLLFGQRYYLNCFDLSGNRIFTRALVESLIGLNIETMSWNVASKEVTIVTSVPHGYQLGTVKQLTVEGCTPDVYNGAYLINVIGPNTLSYSLPADPGEATVLGRVSYLINLAAGYFTSTLVFRNGQFEVSP